jgi:hypothetical protein
VFYELSPESLTQANWRLNPYSPNGINSANLRAGPAGDEKGNCGREGEPMLYDTVGAQHALAAFMTDPSAPAWPGPKRTMSTISLSWNHRDAGVHRFFGPATEHEIDRHGLVPARQTQPVWLGASRGVRTGVFELDDSVLVLANGLTPALSMGNLIQARP